MAEIDPLISVVIPFRGRFDLVAEALHSIRKHPSKRMEILLVDDGSVPPAELNNLGVDGDEQVCLLRSETNVGGGAARNIGIDAAKGKWIAFLDSDDVWISEEMQIRFQLSESADVGCVAIFGRVKVVGQGKPRILPDRGPKPGESMSDYLFLHHGLIQTSTVMVRADIAKKIRFDDKLRKHQDLDFCLRLEDAGHGIQFCEHVLAEWRIDMRPDRTTLKSDPAVSLAWIRSRKGTLSLRSRLAFQVHQVVPQWLRAGKLLAPTVTLLAAAVCSSVSPINAARIFKWGILSRCRS